MSFNLNKNFCINIILLITSVFSTLVFVEIFLRILKLPNNNQRTMFISSHGIINDNYGVRRYKKNKIYRHLAIYGKKVEYDYFFKTDLYGFRKTFDCKNIDKKNDKLIFIAGDSFTEGVGSNISWAKYLQSSICNKGLNSINGAMTGSGIVEMKNTLSFAKNNLNSTHAILSIIPHDILRSQENIVKNNKCSTKKIDNEQINCNKSAATWWHIDNNYSSNEIVSMASEKYKYGIKPIAKQIYYLIKNKLSPNAYRVDLIRENKIIKNSIQVTKQIIETYGEDKFLLVIIPYKSNLNFFATEAEKKYYDSLLDYYKSKLDNDIFISDIRECPLKDIHFYKLDGHPNELGQQKISECVLKNNSTKEFLKALNLNE